MVKQKVLTPVWILAHMIYELIMSMGARQQTDQTEAANVAAAMDVQKEQTQNREQTEAAMMFTKAGASEHGLTQQMTGECQQDTETARRQALVWRVAESSGLIL